VLSRNNSSGYNDNSTTTIARPYRRALRARETLASSRLQTYFFEYSEHALLPRLPLLHFPPSSPLLAPQYHLCATIRRKQAGEIARRKALWHQRRRRALLCASFFFKPKPNPNPGPCHSLPRLPATCALLTRLQVSHSTRLQVSLSLFSSPVSHLPPCTISPSLPPDTTVPVRYDGAAGEGNTSVPAESSAHASRGKESEEWLGVGQRFERSRKSSGSSLYDSTQVSIVLVCLCVCVCAGRVCEGVYWYARVCRVSVINRPLVLPLVLPLDDR
jgi:hypothetical protein